ncbi:MAG: hypothetical protein Q9157_003027 [Trypethelium eluteriae]
MTQLIILRSFQGLGAAGSTASILASFFELLPPSKWALNTSLLSIIYGSSMVSGPIVGGAISDKTTWRWVFLINVPAGAVVIGCILFTLPPNYPFHDLPAEIFEPLSWREKFSKQQLGRIDIPGTISLLMATVFLVAALEEATTAYSWDSPLVIVFLGISGLSWTLSFAWSWWSSASKSSREMVFPWRFVQNRASVGLISLAVLSGAPFTIAIVQLPLRFQSVDDASPLGAGIRLIPFAVLVPAGAGVASAFMGKAKMPPIYLTFVGSSIQVVGFTLLSMTPIDTTLQISFYGYQAVAGFGVGMVYATATVMMPFVAEKRDKAIGTSAIVQFRFMGGAIGLSIVTTVMNSYVQSHLREFLAPAQVHSLLETTGTLSTLSPDLRNFIQTTFASGYNAQMRVVIGLSGGQLLLACLLWRKPQILAHDRV